MLGPRVHSKNTSDWVVRKAIAWTTCAKMHGPGPGIKWILLDISLKGRGSPKPIEIH